MSVLRLFVLLLCLFGAVACGANPRVTQQNVVTAPTSASSATTAATRSASPATSAPSAAPEASTLPPTLEPAPTAPAAEPNAPVPTERVVAATEAPAATAIVATNTPPQAVPAATASEILFLRKGVLVALDPAKNTERTIADGVSDFTSNGSSIALVRGSGAGAEIWTVRRDGSGLVQLTDDDRVDAVPSLAPDGSAIVFASANTAKPYTRSWPDWGQWCAASDVRLIELATNEQRSLGQGCDPAFGPDAKRIAFATPPSGAESDFKNAKINTVRMVNRLGQNGWNLAKTDGSQETGLLVYAPAWSPDGSRLVYHRFLGYQALVDIGMSEISVAFRAAGRPLYSGAGWQLPARFAPNGGRVAITEDNYSDARGFGGYDNWGVTVVPLEGSRSEPLPQGEVTMVGSQTETLPRAQGGAWSPDGSKLAVVLPTGWRPDLPNDQPVNNGEAAPGELWFWTPGNAPQQRVTTGVDFASPVVWLP